jgi:hypothetical protein
MAILLDKHHTSHDLDINLLYSFEQNMVQSEAPQLSVGLNTH